MKESPLELSKSPEFTDEKLTYSAIREQFRSGTETRQLDADLETLMQAYPTLSDDRIIELWSLINDQPLPYLHVQAPGFERQTRVSIREIQTRFPGDSVQEQIEQWGQANHIFVPFKGSDIGMMSTKFQRNVPEEKYISMESLKQQHPHFSDEELIDYWIGLNRISERFAEQESTLRERLAIVTKNLHAVLREIPIALRASIVFMAAAMAIGAYDKTGHGPDVLKSHNVSQQNQGAPLKEKPFLNQDERQTAADLKKNLGHALVEYIRNIHMRAIEERALPPQAIEIKGFETSGVVKDEDVEAILKALPQGIVNGIRSIQYKDVDAKSQRTPKNWPKDKKPSIIAEAGHATRAITFYQKARNQTIDYIVTSVFAHEGFHLNDYISNKHLSLGEKLQLTQALVNRIKSSDRYKSPYVESIEEGNKENELAIKIREYYAEIGGAYFSKDYAKLQGEDRAIIETVIKKTDPRFNRSEAVARLEAIKQKVRLERQAAASQAAISSNPVKHRRVSMNARK